MDSIILKKRYSAWHPTCQCTIYPSTFTWVLPIERRKCSSTASRILSWKATTCVRSSKRRPPLIPRCFSISYCRQLFSTLDTVWRGDTSSRILEPFWHLRFLERSFQHFSSGNLSISRFMTWLCVLLILSLFERYKSGFMYTVISIFSHVKEYFSFTDCLFFGAIISATDPGNLNN